MDANPRSYDRNKKPTESANNAEVGGAVNDGSTPGSADVKIDYGPFFFIQARNARKACPDGVPLPDWINNSRDIGDSQDCYYLPRFINIFAFYAT